MNYVMDVIITVNLLSPSDASVNYAIMGSDNDLSPLAEPAIDSLSIGP